MFTAFVLRVQNVHARTQSDRLADRICASEIISNPDTNKAWLDEIKTLVGNATHV